MAMMLTMGGGDVDDGQAGNGKQNELERPKLRELAWETWDLSFSEWERVNETRVNERMTKKRSKLYRME